MFRQVLVLLALGMASLTAHGADGVRVEGSDEWRVQAAKVRYAIRQVLTSESIELVAEQSSSLRTDSLRLVRPAGPYRSIQGHRFVDVG